MKLLCWSYLWTIQLCDCRKPRVRRSGPNDPVWIFLTCMPPIFALRNRKGSSQAKITVNVRTWRTWQSRGQRFPPCQLSAKTFLMGHECQNRWLPDIYIWPNCQIFQGSYRKSTLRCESEKWCSPFCRNFSTPDFCLRYFQIPSKSFLVPITQTSEKVQGLFEAIFHPDDHLAFICQRIRSLRRILRQSHTRQVLWRSPPRTLLCATTVPRKNISVETPGKPC